jgi:hypothetical protein
MATRESPSLAAVQERKAAKRAAAREEGVEGGIHTAKSLIGIRARVEDMTVALSKIFGRPG